MARVTVVFTGGTISMGFDPVAGGNVPSLDGAAILARTPGLDAIAEVVPIDRGLTPASHFSFADVLEIGRVVQSALDDPAVDGVVVVQGTDTIEETAFAWDLVLTSPKPVVVTGAMRASHEDGYDGPANLRGAVAVAAASAARDVRGRREPGRHDRAGRRRDEDAHLVVHHLPVAEPGVRWGASGRAARSRSSGARGPRRAVRPVPADGARVELVQAGIGSDGALLDAAVAAGATGSSSPRPGPGTRRRACWPPRNGRSVPASRSCWHRAVLPAPSRPPTPSRVAERPGSVPARSAAAPCARSRRASPWRSGSGRGWIATG